MGSCCQRLLKDQCEGKCYPRKTSLNLEDFKIDEDKVVEAIENVADMTLHDEEKEVFKKNEEISAELIEKVKISSRQMKKEKLLRSQTVSPSKPNDHLKMTLLDQCVPPVVNNIRRKKAMKELPKIEDETLQPRTSLNVNSELNSTNNTTANTSSLNISEDIRFKNIREYIKKALSVEQVTFILNIFSSMGLITDDMDTDTLKQLINHMKYFKVEAGVTFYPNEKIKKSEIWIIEQGKIEDQGSEEDDILVLGEGICFTQDKSEILKKLVLIENAKTVETSYIYTISYDKYNQVMSNYNQKLKVEKMNTISNMPIFKNLEQSKLTELSEKLNRKIYYEDDYDQNILLSDEEIPEKISFIVNGSVNSYKQGRIVRKLSNGDYFGEIALFCSMESYYTYVVEEELTVYELSYMSIFEIIGDNYIKDLIYCMFIGAVKKCGELSKHLDKDSLFNFFNLFSLKYYFKDSVCSFMDKKICVVVTGRLMKRENFEIVAGPGDLFGSHVVDEVEGFKNVISEDECVIFEAPWQAILRSLRCSPAHNITIYERVCIMKSIQVFNGLSEWKLFRLAEMLKSVHFKNGETIIKEGPQNDKFYIIKEGKVDVFINGIFIKELDKNESFGEVSCLRRYSRPATFVAKGKVDCWMIIKEFFDEVLGSNELKPHRKLMMLKDITISLENLYFVKDIGHGGFGKVFQVHDGKNTFAVKVAEIKKCRKNGLYKYYLNEKNVMSSIDHPFVVKLVNTFKNKEHIFFLMEFIEGYTLKYYLDNRNRGKSRDLYETQFYGGILLTIASYLQKIRVLHRDIKPSNCMIEKNGYLKLIDFGVAKDMIGKDYTTTMVGTAHYMPPEMVLGKGYSFSADYWTIGVVIYEIFYGCLPFGNNSMGLYEVYDEITEKKLSLPSDTKFVDLNNFLRAILNKDPNKRISNLSQVKNTAFFKNFKFDDLLNMTLQPPQINKKFGEKFHKGKNDEFLSSTFPFDNYIEHEYYSKKENDYYSSNSDDMNWLEDF